MSLPDTVARRLSLPVVCAPMFLISGPELVIEARKKGIIGSFPRQNCRSRQEFESWLDRIRGELDAWSRLTGGIPGPLAVNVSTRLEAPDLAAELDLCARYGVDIIITSVGRPTLVVAQAHDLGLLVHHDITSLLFAEKAIAAGVDGLNCIGSGGGGHSGTVSHLALVPRIRRIFDGTISLAGAVSTGAAVRAAEVLGADLAFMGTRFAATVESTADPRQKELIVSGSSIDLDYTHKVNGVPANWMRRSLTEHGVHVEALDESVPRGHAHLPDGVLPWRDLWSAGQGIELIDDIPTTADLVDRLAREYLVACGAPSFASRADRLLSRSSA